jgi:nucleoside-diphosphate-sugar epimerase
MNLLVTGASGAIGKAVCQALARRGHAVRRFDRTPSAGGHGDAQAPVDEVCADIADHGAVLGACAGVEAIVHLAATPDDAPFPELLAPNVVGLFNVLDAAKQAGVRRVVLASSVQVSWHREGEPRRAASDVIPANHYALTKAWAEQMGEMYARTLPMTVIAARIGWMVRDLRGALHMRKAGMARHYISRADISHFMACAIEAPVTGFKTLFAVGPDGRAAYDLDTAAAAIGYDPQDHFPVGLPFALPESDLTLDHQ